MVPITVKCLLVLATVIMSSTIVSAAKKTKKTATTTPAAAKSEPEEAVQLWPTSSITYELDLRMPIVYQTIMRIAFEEVENKTCLRFTERPAAEDDDDEATSLTSKVDDPSKSVLMVRFSRDRRCASSLGYKALPYQFISLHPVCFASLGSILRQVMLTLGIDNEHNRPDRDRYVTVNWKNIPEKSRKNFQKFTKNPAYDLGLPYDYTSLMHFKADAYALNKTVPTVIPKRPLRKGVMLGQRANFSALDLKKINLLYCKNGKDGISE